MMDNKLQVRKNYIDSRFKTPGSKSSSDLLIYQKIFLYLMTLYASLTTLLSLTRGRQ